MPPLIPVLLVAGLVIAAVYELSKGGGGMWGPRPQRIIPITPQSGGTIPAMVGDTIGIQGMTTPYDPNLNPTGYSIVASSPGAIAPVAGTSNAYKILAAGQITIGWPQGGVVIVVAPAAATAGAHAGALGRVYTQKRIVTAMHPTRQTDDQVGYGVARSGNRLHNLEDQVVGPAFAAQNIVHSIHKSRDIEDQVGAPLPLLGVSRPPTPVEGWTPVSQSQVPAPVRDSFSRQLRTKNARGFYQATYGSSRWGMYVTDPRDSRTVAWYYGGIVATRLSQFHHP
jgi:hypothetical protein